MTNPINRLIHGTYPFDNAPDRWIKERSLKPAEAAELLGIPSTDVPPGSSNPDDGTIYLWLNKGYVVIGADQGIDGFSAASLEMAFGAPAERDWPVGTSAVYLHDGKYSLIRRCMTLGEAEKFLAEVIRVEDIDHGVAKVLWWSRGNFVGEGNYVEADGERRAQNVAIRFNDMNNFFVGEAADKLIKLGLDGGKFDVNAPRTQEEDNTHFLQLQAQIQHENQRFTTLSKTMKDQHETAKDAIRKIR